ncbi:uncharacterized protein LOC114356681 isoform X2 [Ostrinia furnacalis]|uniref:uncharacterized protein LOC114356681 isoform X2 n=1 Tax=Ostrinia furnacalis TaxID=93504 RepID=UPI00103A5D7B|nr:uncharacterized protein LOC114356681 isoform X2 [Ostrinia furnacalis]
MEECKKVSPNNLVSLFSTKCTVNYCHQFDKCSNNAISFSFQIIDAVVVHAEQHDFGVDSPPGNLLDLLPVYPEEDALLETIAAMDIPDPLDIDVNPSGFLLPPPATHQLPDVTSEGLAEVDRLVALYFNS